MNTGALMFDPSLKKKKKKKTKTKSKDGEDDVKVQALVNTEIVLPTADEIVSGSSGTALGGSELSLIEKGPPIKYSTGPFLFRQYNRKYKRQTYETDKPLVTLFFPSQTSRITSEGTNDLPWMEGADDNESGRDYTYFEMLGMIRGTVGRRRGQQQGRSTSGNAGMSKSELLSLLTPTLLRKGTNHIVWTNYPECCKALSRNSEHVRQFVLKELNTTGTMNAVGQLSLNGFFKTRDIILLLKNYIQKYVECAQCGSINTRLVKNTFNKKIIYEVHCSDCTALKPVDKI